MSPIAKREPPTPGRYLQIPVAGKVGYLAGRHKGQIEVRPVPTLVAWDSLVGAAAMTCIADGTEVVRLTLDAQDIKDVLSRNGTHIIKWLALPLDVALEYLIDVDRGPVSRLIRDRNAEFKAVETTQTLAWRLWWETDLVIASNPLVTLLVLRTPPDEGDAADMSRFVATIYVESAVVGTTTIPSWAATAPCTQYRPGHGSTLTIEEVAENLCGFLLDGLDMYDVQALRNLAVKAGTLPKGAEIPRDALGPLALAKAVGTWCEPDTAELQEVLVSAFREPPATA